MVSALDSISGGTCSSTGRGTVLHSWARHFFLIVPLSTQGWVVRKPINVNPGLKVNREFNFSCIKVFLSLMFCEV